MSQTLIISDVHEDMSKLRHIEETLIPQAKHVIMLGDFWDTFKPIKYPLNAAEWVKAHIHDDTFTFCWGNHDAHYAFKHRAFRASGYNGITQLVIDEVLTPEDWRKFNVFTKVGKFLISHAGFHPELMAFTEPVTVETALEYAFNGDYHALWSPGRARGGYSPVGGPIWLDWGLEFEPTEVPQIVGHSFKPDVRVKVHEASGEVSYCVDTALRHVVWTDGEQVEIVRV